ncbi:MAG: DUF4326 domain-containing protein [Allosphingosinicella sp.]
MPFRVQLRRTRGWRKPLGVIVCARPARWGNPFYICPQRDAATCVSLFRNMLVGFWDPSLVNHLSAPCLTETYRTYGNWLSRFTRTSPVAIARAELRGRDLGCWCRLCDRHREGKPLDEVCPDCAICHVDPLGLVANG